MYSTIVRNNSYKVGRIVTFSAVITTSETLSSANDLAVNLPESIGLTDAFISTVGGNSYAVYVSGNRLKPNSSLPANTYFANFTYVANQ